MGDTASITLLRLVEARAERQPLHAFRAGPMRVAQNRPSPGSCASYEPLEDCVDGLCEQCERCAREGRRDHQRLRRAALAMLLAPS